MRLDFICRVLVAGGLSRCHRDRLPDSPTCLQLDDTCIRACVTRMQAVCNVSEKMRLQHDHSS